MLVEIKSTPNARSTECNKMLQYGFILFTLFYYQMSRRLLWKFFIQFPHSLAKETLG